MNERGSYIGLAIMLKAYKVFGRRVFQVLLFPVVGYFYATSKTARNSSLNFLKAVHANPVGCATIPHAPTWRHSFKHFLCFGDSILDKLLAWGGHINMSDADIENIEIFEELVVAGKGAVLVTSHLGNAEVSRALSSRIPGVKFNIVVHTKHAQRFNQLLQRQNAKSAVVLIETTDFGPATAMRLKACVDRGEFVVIVADRTPVGQAPRVSWAPFLGRPAPFPQGPFIISAVLNQPIILLFCLKKGDRFKVILEPFSDGRKMERRSRDEQIDAAVVKFAARLEHHALKYPYQWFNFFDFWAQ